MAVDQILNPQLWIILWLLEVFWKALQFEVSMGTALAFRPPRQGCFGVAVFLMFWLCRTPVANQIRHQRLGRDRHVLLAVAVETCAIRCYLRIPSVGKVRDGQSHG